MADQATAKKIVNPPHLASHYIDAANMPWEKLGPGSERKVLFHDPVTDQQTWLCRLAPGASIPLHEHPGVEQTFVLEGSFSDDEGTCSAGNFVWRPTGSRHIGRTATGVTFLAFFSKPSRRLPQE